MSLFEDSQLMMNSFHCYTNADDFVAVCHIVDHWCLCALLRWIGLVETVLGCVWTITLALAWLFCGWLSLAWFGLGSVWFWGWLGSTELNLRGCTTCLLLEFLCSFRFCHYLTSSCSSEGCLGWSSVLLIGPCHHMFVGELCESSPAVTRLTVYRRPQVTQSSRAVLLCEFSRR